MGRPGTSWGLIKIAPRLKSMTWVGSAFVLVVDHQLFELRDLLLESFHFIALIFDISQYAHLKRGVLFIVFFMLPKRSGKVPPKTLVVITAET